MRKGTAIVLSWLLASAIALAQIAPSKQASGSITVAQGAVQLQTAGYASAGIQITGTFSQTLQFEGTTDGSTWAALSVTPSSSTTTTTSATSTGLWTASTAGLVGLRVRASAWVSGTAVVTIVGNQTGARAAGAGAGSITSIATTAPITGGTITSTGTIECATCGVTGTGLNQFASTTSAQLAGVLSDETGSGVAVFGTSPTLTTDVTVPLVIGGTTTTSPLTLKATSGVGTTGADVIVQSGNNGANELGRFYNAGQITLGAPCTATGCNSVPSFGVLLTPTGGNVNFVTDVFAAAVGGPTFIGRHARGSISSPAQTASGDNLWQLIGRGWNDTGPAWNTNNNGTITIQTTEAHTSTAQGTKILFGVTPNSSTTVATVLQLTTAGLQTGLGGSAITVANVGANSCGTSAASVAGNQSVGEVTVGATSGTQCRVAISQATATRFNGACSNQTTAALCRVVAVDTTHFDLIGAFTAGDVLAYAVMAR
jgi:hypothetical protein